VTKPAWSPGTGQIIETLQPVRQEPSTPHPNLVLIHPDPRPDLTQRNAFGAQQDHPRTPRDTDLRRQCPGATFQLDTLLIRQHQRSNVEHRTPPDR
jgi:hypothetical protein